MAAAKARSLYEQQAKERQATSGPGTYGGKPLMANLPQAVGLARDAVGEVFGVSVRW